MSYAGSKGQAGTWHRIIGQVPECSVFLEGFFGSGKVFWEMLRAANSIVIDIDPRCLTRAAREPNVRAIRGDTLKVLPDLSPWLSADAVGYFDPPYLLATRQGRLYYDHEPEVSDPQWHEKLLDLLCSVKFKVLLSGYPSPLYSSRLRGWRLIEYDTMTRGGKRRECLWMNFPEPERLHDWRFAGFNKRQRYNFKRYVGRFFDGLDKKPAREAGYIEHALLEEMSRRQARRPRPEKFDRTSPLVASVATTK